MTPDPDDWEGHWERQSSVASRNPAQQFRHRLVIREVRSSGSRRIVDVGSGQGDLLVALSRHLPSRDLAGVELSQSGVDATLKKIPDVQVVHADLTSPGYVPFVEDFDCLTCVEVLEHLDNPLDFLRQALAHVRPGAHVVITVPSGPRTAFDVSIGHRDHFTRAKITELLAEAGLSGIRVRRAGFPFFNLYRLTVLLRGKKLIEDVSSSSIESSRLAATVMFAFGLLMRCNLNSVPLGWQLVATGTKRT